MRTGDSRLPGLPAGHYRVEVSQLGFDVAVSESDVAAAPPPPPLEITMKVASLEAMAPPLAAPAAQEQAGAAGTANASTEAAAESARPAAGPGSGWSRRIPRGTRERRCRGQRRRSGPAECARGEGSHRARRQWRPPGSFQAVNLDGNGDATEDQDQAATMDAARPAPGVEADALGQASSSDAFLMAGTVGRGDDTAGGFGPGGGFGGPGGPGGFGGPGDQGGAIPGFQAGAGGAAGFGGPGPGGGPGGGFGGGAGLGGGPAAAEAAVRVEAVRAVRGAAVCSPCLVWRGWQGSGRTGSASA